MCWHVRRNRGNPCHDPICVCCFFGFLFSFYFFFMLIFILFPHFFVSFGCCARVSCYLFTYLSFIARVRAYLRVCLLLALARTCVTHHVLASMTGVGIVYVCFPFLLCIIFCFVLPTRNVPVCESVQW